MTGTTQHHCPVCGHVAKPRCYARNHLVRCDIHDVHHSVRSECARCKDEAKREEKKEREERKAQEMKMEAGKPAAELESHLRAAKKKWRKSKSE
ncbi:hypothetical protein QBC35DRAFT_447715 [Podospora australis]|uniref:Uncharacterized protein n=1 Tax=Podospora australis TaxID=1536484 RepID=A0AAN6X239_9PEZI|nr:hypothetical protein QBC35DRAFT_447715 [Podospora australis]